MAFTPSYSMFRHKYKYLLPVLSQKFLRRISTFLTQYSLSHLSMLDLANFAS